MRVTSVTLALASTISLGSALGINCRGSGNCPGIAGSLDELISRADAVDDNRSYQNGQNIVCIESKLNNGLCAFLQGTGGMLGKDIKVLLRDLRNHGCGKCGSIPVFFPSGDNNPDTHGILTVNAVGTTNGCNGVC